MRSKQLKTLIITWIVAICLALCAAYVTFIDCGYTKVCFLDVGQGDSCYIKTESGSTILIDGGDKGSGKYVLEPFLRKEFALKLDAVFISHIHNDHMMGIIELLESDYDIDTVYVSDRASASDGYENLARLAEKNSVTIKTIVGGDTVKVDNIIFSVVASGYVGAGEEDENDNSLILRMDCGENSVLFTGDATGRYEKQIMDSTEIDTDFLKVGHHGSYTSSGVNFLKKVSPEISIICVGQDNRYGLPSEHTLMTMDELSIPVMRTDYDGTISIIMTDDDVKNIEGSRERSGDR